MTRIQLWHFLGFMVVGLAQGSDIEFSYSYYDDYGPRRWMLLSFDDATNQCDGSSQSPVKLPKNKGCDRRSDVEFSGGCSTEDMTFAITSYSVEAVMVDSSKCSFQQSQKSWSLQSLHAHLGWEHYFSVDNFMEQDYSGIRSRSELQFVHKSTDGDILVVAVWLEGLGSNSDHPSFESLLMHWNTSRSIPDKCRAERRHLDEGNDDTSSSSSTSYTNINPYNLIPSGSPFFSYKGSLTTPPCTEGVSWRVFETHVPISARQFYWLRDLVITGYIDPDTCQPTTVATSLNSTVRPAQHRNGRKISRSCPTIYVARMFLVWATCITGALGMIVISVVHRQHVLRPDPKQMDNNPLVDSTNDDSPPKSITIQSPQMIHHNSMS